MRHLESRAWGEWVVAVLGLGAGVLFFLSLGRLWPLVDLDLVRDRQTVETRARQFLRARGFDLDGYRSSSALVVASSTLDYVDRELGRSRAQELIDAGLPLVSYRVFLKKRGETTYYTVEIHPEAGILGWSRWLEEDEPGASLALDEARSLALDALSSALALDPGLFQEKAAATTEQLERRDHSFRFEALHSTTPELREWVRVVVTGDEVSTASRFLVVPAAARRQRRAEEAPGRALETLGFVLMTAAAVGAFFVFLFELGAGEVHLGQSMVWPSIVVVCLVGTYALETPTLFRFWEPLWPKWVSDFQYLSRRGLEGLGIGLLLLVVVAAGDALDSRSGARRGESLWRLARLRLDATVARASGRGFVVGLLCGGVMTGAILLLQWGAGARTALQPRGFFFYTLNTAAPALTSLLFFFAVALAEELGYRFFAGGWLLSVTRRPWLAVGVPAVIYGLTHTRLDFLPPAEPWWGRALVLTLVGCVWGWAFLRYDALTVVLSHFTADLFIFNWPRLASGDAAIVAVSALTIAVPLLPGAWWLLRRWASWRNGGA